MTTPDTPMDCPKHDEIEAMKQAIVRLAHAVSVHIGTENYKEICEILYPNCTKDWK